VSLLVTLNEQAYCQNQLPVATQRHNTSPRGHLSMDDLCVSGSQKPLQIDQNTIMIRSFVHPFFSLPQELQQLIIGFAIGKARSYEPGRSRFHEYMRSMGRPFAGTSPMLCACMLSVLIPYSSSRSTLRHHLYNIQRFKQAPSPLDLPNDRLLFQNRVFH